MIAHDGLHERRGSLEKLESMVGFWAILEVGERLDEGVLHEMGIQCAARRDMWGSYVCDEYITRGVRVGCVECECKGERSQTRAGCREGLSHRRVIPTWLHIVPRTVQNAPGRVASPRHAFQLSPSTFASAPSISVCRPGHYA